MSSTDNTSKPCHITMPHKYQSPTMCGTAFLSCTQSDACVYQQIYHTVYLLLGGTVTHRMGVDL